MSKHGWFEDYAVGQKGVTDTRTVSDADIAQFAYVAEDYNKPHLDKYFMSSSIYGDRVAHGLLGSSLAVGLISYSHPYIIGRGVPDAHLYYTEFNYKQGLRLDETISIHWNIVEKTPSPGYPGFGLIKTAYQLVNQADSAVYDGTLSILVKMKSAPGASLNLVPGKNLHDISDFTPEEGRIYYAEDYQVGNGGVTDGRTITETDIVNYAGLTGDFNPLHVDAEFARKSMFGTRTAHPMLVFCAAYGLWLHAWHRYTQPVSKRAAAGHLGDTARFLAPVMIGDTVHCRWKVTANRVSRSRPELGIITFGLQVVNQRSEVVHEGSTSMMVGSKSLAAVM